MENTAKARPVEKNKLRISIIAQLTPIGRYQNPDHTGHALGDQSIEQYTDGLTKYLGEQLERFADPRGGDVFLHVVVDDETGHAGREYRSGHFVKDEKNGGEDGTDELDVHKQAPADPAGT